MAAYMRESKDRLKCDNCGKIVEAHKECYAGGHPFHGWLILERRNINIYLLYPRPRHLDFCSVKCLKKYEFKWEEL